MNSPFTATVWEIWRRNRRPAWLVVGIVSFGWLFNLLLPDGYRASPAGRERLLIVNSLLLTGSIFLVFAIFNYTEFNPQKEWTGFPYRLFTLPVATWKLAAAPMALGVAAVELVFLAWAPAIFDRGEQAQVGWIGVLIASYMVFYQAALWALAGFKSLRVIVLSLVGTSAVAVACLPFVSPGSSSPWFSRTALTGGLLGLVLVAYLFSWISLARQRSGGGRRRNWLKIVVEFVSDNLPRRRREFASPSAAQYWYEWRRGGWLLPLCIGVMLVFVVLPLSWKLRGDPVSTIWILAWTLAMPVILAFPLGMALSVPDPWSKNRGVPAFVAIRPLTSGDLVVVRMKIAALAAALSWALVVAFLAVWLPLWANQDALGTMRVAYWMVYDHSTVPQYFMAGLFIVAGALVTWRLLVEGLWTGLSGKLGLYIASIAGYPLAGLLALIGLMVALRHDEELRAWIHRDPDRLLALVEWAVGIGVVVKFWLAAVAWRQITPRRARGYLLLWSAGAVCLLLLGMFLWAGGTLDLALNAWLDFWPLDPRRLRGLLFLAALLVIPLARLGLAPSALSRNRHR